MMQISHEKSKRVRWVVILSLLLKTVSWADDDDIRAINVKFTSSENQIVIHYDLLGPSDAKPEVTVRLKKESDRAFIYTPKNLTGDVGMGIPPGLGKAIQWDIAKEFPQGLAGSDYYFEVNLNGGEQSGGGSAALTWIGAGAAVLGAGILAVVLAKNHSEPPPQGSSFPAPPGRP
ncbi:MAG: hypothetical protein E6K56_07575 [Ignavibacteria bacterium]|nr:MAG: hypothetical protein E6K56_07575 [Ignavibacteria bacterium]